MNARQHDILRVVEDAHWWHRTLRGLVLRELRGLPSGARVLDAGCGTGGMLNVLGRREAHGIDLSPVAVEHCRKRGLRNVIVAPVHDMPFAAASFDAVLCLDVLYHSQVDEGRALAEMARVLKPGASLVVNVPAMACLRGAHDKAVCGARRYSAASLREKFHAAGFEAQTLHYWNAWLFLPLLLRRRFSSNEDGDLSLPPRWLNNVLATGGRLDARLCRKLRLPFGSSLFAVAAARPLMLPDRR